MSGYILAVDQGTTSSRAIVFGPDRRQLTSSQKEITQFFPASGLVEHDAVEIWQSVVETARDAISKADIRPEEIAGIGITNQRETVVVWDRQTGTPIHRAIVWQDRRTAAICEALQSQGAAPLVEQRTGLLLDPYFSATKVAWLLDNVAGARKRAETGQLLFGTIDSYLIWMLTGGSEHATDATNASRTSLFNIATNCWDPELLSLFRVPKAMLPEVKNCAASFGVTQADIFGACIPICGVAGDQQAATIGQQCMIPGMIKATYGTGCFVVLNTGNELVRSKSRMLSTIAYRIEEEVTYALEGSIFVAGAAVQWLRDSLKFIQTSAQAGDLASSADGGQDVVIVPAFAGLGAPYWDPHARGAIFGLTRAAGPAELARATLQSVCFQTRDLLDAMAGDYGFDLEASGLRVDGGMAVSDWTMQGLSDCLGCNVDRAAVSETTALGAASLAGMQAGVWPSIFDSSNHWAADRTFEPMMAEEKRQGQYERWKRAVQCTLDFASLCESRSI